MTRVEVLWLNLDLVPGLPEAWTAVSCKCSVPEAQHVQVGWWPWRRGISWRDCSSHNSQKCSWHSHAKSYRLDSYPFEVRRCFNACLPLWHLVLLLFLRSRHGYLLFSLRNRPYDTVFREVGLPDRLFLLLACHPCMTEGSCVLPNVLKTFWGLFVIPFICVVTTTYFIPARFG